MAKKINIFSLIRKTNMAFFAWTALFSHKFPLLLAVFLRGLSCFRNNSKRHLTIFFRTSHSRTLACSFTLVIAFFLFAVHEQPIPAGYEIDPHAASATEDLLPNVREIVGEIRPGDSLVSSFRANGVEEDVQQSIVSAFAGMVDFRDMKPQDRYTLTLDDDGSLVKCLFESGDLKVHSIERTAEGSLKAKKVDVALDCRTVKLQGKIESSLFAAISSSKENPKLIYNFADIFASKIDFNTETRFGDTFELVFEKYYKKNQFVGYGKILVARYNSKELGPLEAFYFDRGENENSYFDQRGNELGESFIRSPLPLGKVSSGFSYNRLHPIFNIVRPHLGVDLAAPVGTPIMAASDGRVNFANWKGGFGKLIILDHSGGYQTYYAHLSRFADNIKDGAKVRQKQIIGYVGATGNATGPHLDYRIAKNGVFANPFNVKFNPRSQLTGTQLVIFRQNHQALTHLARKLDDPKIIIVKNVVTNPDNPISML